MYNRYVPQSDGSFRRSRMPDNAPHPPAPPQPAPPVAQIPLEPSPEVITPLREPRRNVPPHPYRGRPKLPHKDMGDSGILAFLRQLLPRDFDSGDLLVVLLLLLMSGDCQEDQNTALLTLVLYLFL